jgi:hypothetical protein
MIFFKNLNLQETAMSKTYLLTILSALSMLAITGCTDATVASRNLSKSAEMFELNRRIVFYNGITGEYVLTIEGRCSIDVVRDILGVTCKTAPGEFKKHYLGLSDNVTYFSEQIDSKSVDAYRYRVVFKPSVIVPDIEKRG